MSGNWRKDCPREVRTNQEMALSARGVYLVRQTGPTAYILQQESKKDPVKVCLGEQHRCTCREFQNRPELCFHICWVLLKKLRISPSDPLSFQVGLNERQLNEALNPKPKSPAKPKPRSISQPPSRKSSVVRRRDVSSQDACPICLETLVDAKTPLVYCKYSCGNGMHLACMEIVAHHQTLNKLRGDLFMLSCPLCRGDFCRSCELREVASRPTALVRPVAAHPSLSCSLCSAGPPLLGNVYRCLQCPNVILCALCLNSPSFVNFHSQHGLAIKATPESRWLPLEKKPDPKSRQSRPEIRRVLLPSIPKRNSERTRALGDALSGLIIKKIT